MSSKQTTNPPWNAAGRVFFPSDRSSDSLHSTLLLKDITAAWAENKDARSSDDAEWIQASREQLASILDLALTLVDLGLD